MDEKAETSVVSILLSEVNDEKNKEDRETTVRSLTGAAYAGNLLFACVSAPLLRLALYTAGTDAVSQIPDIIRHVASAYALSDCVYLVPLCAGYDA